MPRIRDIRPFLRLAAWDLPRYLAALYAGPRDAWRFLHNKGERIVRDDDSGGVRCHWRYASVLEAPRRLPWLGRRLLARALAAHPIAMAPALPANRAGPQVSFIIGHAGDARLRQLDLTLASLAAQEGVDVEVIVIDLGTPPTAEAVARQRGARYHPILVPEQAGLYNRARAFNEGAVRARGEILVLHDGDLLVSADYAAHCLGLASQGYAVMNLKRFIFYLDPSGTRGLRDGRIDVKRIGLEQIVQNSGAGGSVAVTRDAYRRLGGFDEDFIGWGGEDNEFWDRAATLRRFDSGFLPLLHLWHPSQPGKRAVQGMGRHTRDVYLQKMERPVTERIRACRRRLAARFEGAARAPSTHG